MHGRDKLHHLRTMAFMPIPYSRSPLLARVTFVYSAPVYAMTQTLDLP
jgi:hypothetical protein